MNKDHINAIDKLQRYIEEHLQETISLYDLASHVGYSPYHITRVFKELLGISPFEYIRNRRLSVASYELSEGKKVIDVAFDFVFGSPEGFSRAFSKTFGVAPKKYQMKQQPIPLFLPYFVRERYVDSLRGEKRMSEKNVLSVFVQVIERPKRKVLLKRGVTAKHYFEYCEEVPCDVWGILCSVKEAIYEPVGMWLPEHLITEGSSEYVQGVEVPFDYEGNIPDGFELIDLPPCKMMVFQGPPFEDEAFGEAIEDLWKVIETYDPTIYGFTFAPEDGPRIQLEPQGYRGYIEAKPVRIVE